MKPIAPGAHLAVTFALLCASLGASCSGGPLSVGSIQGKEQYSPFAAQRVQFEAIVTAVLPQEGFFAESERRDGDSATSDGVLILGDTARIGDRVAIDGVVVEVQRNPKELPLTTISVNPGAGGSGGVTVLESGVSRRGAEQLADSPLESLEDAIAFWEAYEGMRVQVDRAAVIAPTNRFGESAVVIGGLANLPAGLAVASQRGSAVLLESRYLPSRILVDDTLAKQPELLVADQLSNFEAIVDYRFGEYRLYPVDTLEGEHLVRSDLDRERSSLPAERRRSSDGELELTIASINVQNLDLGDDPRRFGALARVIVDDLGSPELVALQEMQDDSGPIDDGEVGSEATHGRLIEAIRAAGGPEYAFREVRPGNNQDGGEPWGNIRCSFLFRTNQGLRFVDQTGGSPSAQAASISGSGQALSVAPSPGRIDPANSAFEKSRKPLVGVFELAGRRLVVVNVHFASKGSDDPAFGMRQPPERGSEPQRNAQAEVVGEFVSRILRADPQAAVVVIGDFNDFYFTQALTTFEQIGLTNLIKTLPPEERYSYIFRGQAQALDHLLVSPSLESSEIDIVHLNSEFPESGRGSDHDPLVARLRFGAGSRD